MGINANCSSFCQSFFYNVKKLHDRDQMQSIIAISPMWCQKLIKFGHDTWYLYMNIKLLTPFWLPSCGFISGWLRWCIPCTLQSLPQGRKIEQGQNSWGAYQNWSTDEIPSHSSSVCCHCTSLRVFLPSDMPIRLSLLTRYIQHQT